jgi:hypothetical protein
MTFHKLKESTRNADNDLVISMETSLLRHGTFTMVTPQPEKAKILGDMTGSTAMQDSSVKAGFDSLVQLPPDDEMAHTRYQESHAVDGESSGLKDLTRNSQKATKHDVKGRGRRHSQYQLGRKMVGQVTKNQARFVTPAFKMTASSLGMLALTFSAKAVTLEKSSISST